ncbi:MAG: SAM-dependent DNA methyltransferase [Methylococcaceae bacterium]|nr:SAM-dependent DNA methyltransferase [Methylococcaceae bacterium]
MPLTPDMRRSIDQIRDYLFGGGYPDPVANAEQLSFLFFFYLIEGIDAENVLKAEVLKQPYQSLFIGDWTLKNPLNAPKQGQITIPRDRFRWSVWAKGLSGEALVRFLRDEVFAFVAELGEKSAHNFMNGARLSIDEPTVLTQIINLVDGLRLDQADADTKGDLFEHVLKQIKQAGELGQFRTPRHIIRSIVEIIDPKIGETIYDPAAGTAGFLVAAYNHIRLGNSSPSAIQETEIDGKIQIRGLGDKLSSAQISALQTATFFGNDVDPKMIRLATMNLTLRGLPNVRILMRNVLTTTLDAEKRAEYSLPAEGYHVVLANPPFSGRVDKDRIVEDVKVGTSTATELLFLKYMMDSLRPGGRCGVIVPEGVLFGSTTAHKELRRQLIENNRVEAVLSLPGGVFQPYSGVKTSVLFFKRGGNTERVLFLHADNDGYKLDANHDTPIEQDDLPALIDTYRSKDERWQEWLAFSSPLPSGEGPGVRAVWTQKWWFADTQTLRANDFNLSAGRYRPMNQTAVEHRNPRELLDELAAIEAEIVEEVTALRETLAGG